MKRIKLLPSILMLVMCVGVLAMGIYAASPASHAVTGTITVNAANAEVTVEVFNGKSTNESDRIGYDTGRASTEIELEDDILMDASIVESTEELTKYYTVKLSTESSKKLVVDTETIQLLDGTITGGNETIPEALIITKNHTSYATGTVTTDNPKGLAYFTNGTPYVITCAIKIGELPDQAFTASLDMQFNVCTATDYTGDGINGIDYLYYGEYPQSEASATIDASVYEIATGETFKIYDGTNGCDSGCYDADGYAIVSGSTATDGETSSTVYKLKADDGSRYVALNSKLYKIEPLKWRILERNAETGRTKLMCDTIVEQVYYRLKRSGNYAYNSTGTITVNGSSVTGIYANNYKYSDIRTYMNKTFYNNAFGTTEKSVMLLEEVVNDDASMGGTDNNNYSCDNTTDYIFALSYQDVINSNYGFDTSTGMSGTRCISPSAFAVSTGAYIYLSEYLHSEPYNCCGGDYAEIEDRDGVIRHWVDCGGMSQEEAEAQYDFYVEYVVNSGYWWLRSPYSSYANYARCVLDSGNVDHRHVVNGYPGCVPALLLGL